MHDSRDTRGSRDSRGTRGSRGARDDTRDARDTHVARRSGGGGGRGDVGGDTGETGGTGAAGERDLENLRTRLLRLDGRGYKAYKAIAGAWAFPDYTFVIDHVQGDPFADPSRVRVLLPGAFTRLPPEVCRPGSREIGVAALLARRFAEEGRRREERSGSGKSGVIRMEAPGQEVIRQSAVRIEEDGSVEARFTVGLPARGRRVLGEGAERLLGEIVPAVIEASLFAGAYSPEEIERHAFVNEDADALRDALEARGLVAFVADGASLPRRSGIDDRPLEGMDEGMGEGEGSGEGAGEGSRVVPLRSPASLRVEIPVPHAGTVSGLGIPRGVTLIVGGGYHGKSTLLRAIEQGVYNHRPGDGRERVVSDAACVKVRAEDRRSIVSVDISPFIRNLPAGDDTRRFGTENASGSTSQAASIMEALEVGASALLVDEDTAATNFMIRDRRMQALVPRESEPIIPFVDRVRALHDERGVSSILVLGGSGDYLDVADLVIAMKAFIPHDVTVEAGRIARELPTGRTAEAGDAIAPVRGRIPLAGSLDPSRGNRSVRIDAYGVDQVRFGEDDIDLSGVEQIVSTAQCRAIGRALLFLRDHLMDGELDLAPMLERLMETMQRDGLDALDDRRPGNLALFRRFEVAAALNRLRTLEMREP